MANILEEDVWICRDMQLRTLRICLLIASSPQEGKIAAAYWFLLSGFGAMLSGTQLIWYILLVLLHKCSFVCISSFHLLLLFFSFFLKKKKKAVGTLSALQSQLHSSVTRASQLFPLLQSRKVNLPVPVHRWMTVVSSAGLLARRCVYTDASVSLSSFQYVPLCVSRQENKMLSRGKGEGGRLECKAWWEAWSWQAWGIWYRCPL